jgi:hypothetical protein
LLRPVPSFFAAFQVFSQPVFLLVERAAENALWIPDKMCGWPFRITFR